MGCLGSTAFSINGDTVKQPNTEGGSWLSPSPGLHINETMPHCSQLQPLPDRCLWSQTTSHCRFNPHPESPFLFMSIHISFLSDKNPFRKCIPQPLKLIRLDGAQICTEMLVWVQVQALAGSIKSIHWVVLKLFLCYLGNVLRVVVLLEGEPSPIVRTRAVCSRLSSGMSLYIAVVPAAEKHPHSMMLPPLCFTAGTVLSILE